MVVSDDPNSEIRIGTKVLYMGRLQGVVKEYDIKKGHVPFYYVELSGGKVILAAPWDLQNINDKREG